MPGLAQPSPQCVSCLHPYIFHSSSRSHTPPLHSLTHACNPWPIASGMSNSTSHRCRTQPAQPHPRRCPRSWQRSRRPPQQQSWAGGLCSQARLQQLLVGQGLLSPQPCLPPGVAWWLPCQRGGPQQQWWLGGRPRSAPGC